jgi:hypothetical protein
MIFIFKKWSKIFYKEIPDIDFVEEFNKRTIANATNLIIWSDENIVKQMKDLYKTNNYKKNNLFLTNCQWKEY